MDEEKFKKLLKDELQKELIDYKVVIGEYLIYKVIIDDNLDYQPKDPKKPRRGDYAFETDLMIKKGELPLVVIETKINKFHTHDVLTYSKKAERHKEIYPYLRYGFVVGDKKVINNKFFTHNVGFDFAVAIENIGNLKSLIIIVKNEIKNAERILKILKNKNTTKSFSTIVNVEQI